ncbi:MAG: GntR family transcriptional regulator [Actinobacteria bacterium]|nr:GntR family transcriptional regulator [Actinomycetota bacterium]
MTPGSASEEKPSERRVRDGHRVTRVHDELRDQILRGEIAPGTSMSQVELAQLLDAGRTPLREALRLLQSEGLIITEPNRNVRVAEFTLDDVEDLYVMRIALECSAALITVPDLAPAEIAELRGLKAQMEYFEAERDHQGWEAPHREFHMKLTGRAGRRSAQTIRQLWDHAGRYRRFYELADPPPWLLRVAEHQRLLDAAEGGDGEEASRQLALHYAGTVGDIVHRADAQAELLALRAVLKKFAGTDRLPDPSKR